MKTSVAGVIAAVVIAMTTSIATARTLQVGAGQDYALPSLAIADARDGDDVVIAAGTYDDCAVIAADNVVIEGAPGATAKFDGKACRGKAALIVSGNGVTIRNLTLANIHVPDANGAGIRAEGKDLTVDNVKFVGNENGILTSANPTSTVIVRDSEFIGNGACVSDCAHGIYAGRIGLLRVQHSKFFETHHGHHIKSRALRTEIVDCDISDGALGNSSYLIDIPDGGALVAHGNTLEKGPLSENRTTAISIGAESAKNPTSEILIDDNTFRNDGAYDTYLIVNRTPADVTLGGNKLAGRAVELNAGNEPVAK